MNQTKFKGNPVHLLGDVPEAGHTAPNFTYVKEDLSEESLYDHGDKIKVIVAVPSLDTGICQLEAKRFNKELSGHADVTGLIVSKDLPFAMKRFCAAEGIENVKIASDFRGNFTDEYKTLMTDGPLKGLSSRVVFVVDKDNKITYTQITDDITVEPNYEEALKAVEKLKN
ncbi:thiol peroxidase [Cryomorphaceae bacterium 1068]|nr:thiol peroxidase [Cryomorphaceae bacterium 1068]